MRNLLVGLMVLGLCSPAFAGKKHRTAKKELMPKISKTQKEVKAACGHAPSIMVNWKAFNKLKTDKIREYKTNIGHELKYVGEHAKKFCSDSDSKKVFKNLKKLVITVDTKSSDPITTFNKGTMQIATTGQMNSGGYKFKSIIEEW